MKSNKRARRLRHKKEPQEVTTILDFSKLKKPFSSATSGADKDISIPELAKNNILLLIILVLAGFLLFGNNLNGDFVSADDLSSIVNDPMSKDLMGSIKTGNLINVYEAFTYQLFNFSPVGFHLSSILLHIINSFLVFLLVSKIANQKTGLFVTLLFLSHPVNSEAVSWISSFVYLVLGFVHLLVYLAFIEYKTTGNKKYMLLSVTVYSLALIFLKTPWLLTIPFALIILDLVLFEITQIKRSNLSEKIKGIFNTHFLFLFTSAIFFFIEIVGKYSLRLSDLKTYHYLDPTKSEPLVNRYSYTITKSLELLTFPLNLTIFHEGEVITTARLALTIGIAVIFCMLIFLLFLNKNYKEWGFALLIFVLVLPSFSPVIIAWFIAERYLYVPSVFFSLLVVLIFKKLESYTGIKNFTVIALSVVLLIFSIRTIVRTNAWKSDKNLWHATLKTSPLSYRVYNNLGDVYFKEKNYDTAILYFAASVKLKPDYADAVHNIGHTFLEKRDYENAKKYLLMSYEMNPILYQSLYKLGVVEYQLGNYTAAKTYFEKTLEIDQSFEPALKALETVNIVLSKTQP